MIFPEGTVGGGFVGSLRGAGRCTRLVGVASGVSGWLCSQLSLSEAGRLFASHPPSLVGGRGRGVGGPRVSALADLGRTLGVEHRAGPRTPSRRSVAPLGARSPRRRGRAPWCDAQSSPAHRSRSVDSHARLISHRRGPSLGWCAPEIKQSRASSGEKMAEDLDLCVIK